MPAGLEAALGAAQGDELPASDANDAAGAESQAPRHWRMLPDLPAESLPDAATPLAARIGGPAVLARRLGRVGLVESPPDATLTSRAILAARHGPMCAPVRLYHPKSRGSFCGIENRKYFNLLILRSIFLL